MFRKACIAVSLFLLGLAIYQLSTIAKLQPDNPHRSVEEQRTWRFRRGMGTAQDCFTLCQPLKVKSFTPGVASERSCICEGN